MVEVSLKQFERVAMGFEGKLEEHGVLEKASALSRAQDEIISALVTGIHTTRENEMCLTVGRAVSTL